ncbi:hypothetical protein [Pontibacter sp. SGAir0037]|uniref:hypothetical protein n=1 Tax=Pontibacter sp. SGAir0037 TaxID=2571030 RepID=UPI0010CCB225|nr:hypothetical protein [Pontibacter sp. SGAir0037]QCR21551.1 hypothetical protein C1N53_03780 [Pontibacter sp. SGAir0037]
MNRFLSLDNSLQLLQNIQASSYPTTYNPEKHKITLLDESQLELLHFRLPITFPPPGAPTAGPVHYVILLVQSGNCAMGYFEDGENLHHKVFRSYMVRKKQGKSQIKHLKTKGKSRAGSRVRLGETIEFFENINERLQVYFEEYEIHRIAISCSKILIPYLYNSKVATPFDKHDERLYKIPKHMHTPIYEVLLDANKFLQKGELIYDEGQQALVDALLNKERGSGEI